jgi:hemolysin activation/secretion protein
MSRRIRKCFLIIFHIIQILYLEGFYKKDQNITANYDNYILDKLSIDYGRPYHAVPSLSPIEEVNIFLSEANQTVYLKDLFAGTSKIKSLSNTDLKTIYQVPIQFLKSFGYEGVVVFTDPSQINPKSGIDLRGIDQSDLRILVWLSRVDEISWISDGITNERLTKMRFKTQKSLTNLLVEGKSFKNKDFLFLKRLENLGSFDTRVKIKESLKPGFILPEIELKPQKKDHLKIFAMNSGTKSTGSWLLGASYKKLDLTQNDDTLDISLLSSDSGKRASLSTRYYIPLIFPDLLSVGSRVSYSFYDATSFAFEKVDFDGSSKSLNMWLDWKPLATESSNQSLSFQTGITLETLKASNSFLSGEGSTTEISIHLKIKHQRSFDYLSIDSSIGLKKNFKELGINDGYYLGGIDVEGRYLRMQAEQLQVLLLGRWLHYNHPDRFGQFFKDHLLTARFASEWAVDGKRHLPQRQFIGGGTGTVRGYPESVAAGDDGIVLSVEYIFRFPSFDLGNQINNASFDLIPFWDYGKTFVNNPFNFESDHTLSSLGLGTRFITENGLTVLVEYGKPLKELSSNGLARKGTSSSDYRIHAKVLWDF